MALIRADAMFKIYGAKSVHKQKVKLRPNEHHYEEEGQEPYIKYSCQLCEQLAKEYNSVYSHSNGLFDADERFIRFSFPKGTEQCPCCGVNIDWDYK